MYHGYPQYDARKALREWMGHGHVHLNLMSNHLQTFGSPHFKNNTQWQLPCCLPLKHANFHYILDLTTSNINKITSHNYNNNYKYVPPGVTVVKNLPTNAGDTRDVVLIPGLGRNLGERSGNPLQYSCLENSMDSGAWWATGHGAAKSQTWQWLSIFTYSVPTKEWYGEAPSGLKLRFGPNPSAADHP